MKGLPRPRYTVVAVYPGAGGLHRSGWLSEVLSVSHAPCHPAEGTRGRSSSRLRPVLSERAQPKSALEAMGVEIELGGHV